MNEDNANAMKARDLAKQLVGYRDTFSAGTIHPGHPPMEVPMLDRIANLEIKQSNTDRSFEEFAQSIISRLNLLENLIGVR